MKCLELLSFFVDDVIQFNMTLYDTRWWRPLLKKITTSVAKTGGVIVVVAVARGQLSIRHSIRVYICIRKCSDKK